VAQIADERVVLDELELFLGGRVGSMGWVQRTIIR
jgi:hypothetical protein